MVEINTIDEMCKINGDSPSQVGRLWALNSKIFNKQVKIICRSIEIIPQGAFTKIIFENIGCKLWPFKNKITPMASM